MGAETYRASCVINLTIRFEQKLMLHEKTSEGVLVDEFVVANRQESTFVHDIVPKKCTVNMKGHAVAAEWSAVFDYQQLPIDPRTIAAVTAEIHLGTIPDDEYAHGIGSREGRARIQTKAPDGSKIDDNLVLVGLCDEWEITQGEENEVHLRGRDLRSLFLDSPLVSQNDYFNTVSTSAERYAGGSHGNVAQRVRRRDRTNILNRLDTTKPIDDVVNQLIRQHDEIQRLPVAERPYAYAIPEEWPNGEVSSPGSGTHIARHRRGARGHGPPAASGASQENLNFWDIITNYCRMVGAVPRFVGRLIEIRYAPTLWSMVSGQNARVPFLGGNRRVENGESWGIRKLIYGRDIKRVTMKRRYSGNKKPKIVRIVCLNPSAHGRGHETMLQAVWPPRTRREARDEGYRWSRDELRDHLAGAESTEVATYRVPGVHTIEQLTVIAQAYYEQIGRQEIAGTVECEKLSSYGGNNLDPDLIRLRIGDPIEILADPNRVASHGELRTILNDLSSYTTYEAIDALSIRIGDENLARAIVGSSRGHLMGVLSFFRVCGVDYDWNDEDGLTVKIDFQNYFTPHWDESSAQRTQEVRQRRGNVDAHHARMSEEVRRALAEAPGANGLMIPIPPPGQRNVNRPVVDDRSIPAVQGTAIYGPRPNTPQPEAHVQPRAPSETGIRRWGGARSRD